MAVGINVNLRDFDDEEINTTETIIHTQSATRVEKCHFLNSKGKFFDLGCRGLDVLHPGCKYKFLGLAAWRPPKTFLREWRTALFV